jgi:hypothetical protein
MVKSDVSGSLFYHSSDSRPSIRQDSLKQTIAVWQICNAVRDLPPDARHARQVLS